MRSYRSPSAVLSTCALMSGALLATYLVSNTLREPCGDICYAVIIRAHFDPHPYLGKSLLTICLKSARLDGSGSKNCWSAAHAWGDGEWGTATVRDAEATLGLHQRRAYPCSQPAPIIFRFFPSPPPPSPSSLSRSKKDLLDSPSFQIREYFSFCFCFSSSACFTPLSFARSSPSTFHLFFYSSLSLSLSDENRRLMHSRSVLGPPRDESGAQ